jgi:hypothetical protein
MEISQMVLQIFEASIFLVKNSELSNKFASYTMDDKMLQKCVNIPVILVFAVE